MQAMFGRPCDRAAPLKVSARSNGVATTAIIVRGEIDISSASVLDTALHRAVTRSGTCVAIDLRGVSFMDVTGVNLLVRADNLARRHGSVLRLTGVSAPVARLLEITSLSRRFDREPCPRADRPTQGRPRESA
jgi:anti-anti-sigma factor